MKQIIEMVLTFLGGGVLTSFFVFLKDRRVQVSQDRQADFSNQEEINRKLFNDLYQEIGRVKQELDHIKGERDEIQKENLRLKEENYKLRLDLNELKTDYEDLKKIFEEFKKGNGI